MKNLQGLVRVGDRIRVRRQRWSVAHVRSYDGCQMLTLRGIGPRNAGRPQYAIVPFEVVEPLETQARLRIVRPRRWRRRCRGLLAATRRAGSLTTAAHSRIDLMPHQLEPALAIIRGLGTRVLVADEVGLGKTIQAGLIVSELRARSAAERVLVLAPAGLREQWASELRDRFDLAPVIVDMWEARRRAAQLPAGVNPWITLPLAITSIDYAKRPEVLPAVRSCRWDVVVVDEAHGVTPGSDRHHAVNALCGLAPYVVLLTATPHNGSRAAFESLCRLGAIESRTVDRLLVFRRSRHDVALGAARRVHSLLVRSSPEEIRMHEQLTQFTRAVRAAQGHKTAEQHLWLTLAILHKRALSSAHSLHASVARRLAGLRADPLDGHRQLTLPLDDGEGELEMSDEAPAWTTPGFADQGRERGMLASLAEAARDASARETKLRTLARLLSRLGRLGEAAIVFTEYRDTLTHVQRTLSRTSPSLGVAGVIHGGLTREERRKVLDDFQNRRVTILLATDAGGEGLNLHRTCRVVINLELPWNPMRLEQRVGRVDRIGQSRRVHAFNVIALDTGELRILDHLKARLAAAREDIGAPDPLESSNDATEETRVLGLVTGEVGDELNPEVVSDGDRPTTSARAYEMPQLAVEAAAEHARLVWARALLSERAGAAFGFTNGLAAEAAAADNDTWLAFAQHPETRSRLAPDVLVLWQSIVEDRLGRVVASQLLPLAVRTGAHVGRAHARRVALEISRTLSATNVRDDADAVTRAFHQQFWNVRLARERAIVAAMAHGGGDTFQPGLFDRRAEHDAGQRATLVDDALQRIAFIEWTVLPDVARAHVALILYP